VQKRELISTDVKTVKAERDSEPVEISVRSPVFTGVVAGACSLPGPVGRGSLDAR
jgi:hypothetical protein